MDAPNDVPDVLNFVRTSWGNQASATTVVGNITGVLSTRAQGETL